MTLRSSILLLGAVLAFIIGLSMMAEEALSVKLVDSKIDRWYRIEKDWGILNTWPDKFQHLFLPYLMQGINQKTVDSENLFWAFNLAGVLKEFEDKEGISFRDILCNTIGLWGAKLQSKRFSLLPSFAIQRRDWKIIATVAL